MITLCNLVPGFSSPDKVVLNQFYGVFSSPKLSKIDGFSAEKYLKMNVGQNFEAFLEHAKAAVNEKKLKPVRDNFDDEAKMLYKRLNLPDPTREMKENNQFSASDIPDVVWVHPTTGAKFYIGNIGAAQNLNVLQKLQIFHIINAQGS